MEHEQLRALYSGPPAEFVAARDALAKELRAAGDRESAAAVKRLRRHSPVQWVLNRVAQARPEVTDAFADAAGAVRAAQAAAIEGRGGDVREAMTRLRERTSALVTAATDVDASVPASQVATLLQGLVADEAATAQLVAGVLGSSALDAADPFAGLTPVERPARAEEPTRARTAERATPRARESPAAAERVEPTTSKAAERAAAKQAREEAARRRGELRDAERRAREAARRESDARVEVDEAERRLADARAGLAEAVADRAAADRDVERLRA